MREFLHSLSPDIPLPDPAPVARDDFAGEFERLWKPVVLPYDRVLFRERDHPKCLFLVKQGEVVFSIHAAGKHLQCFTVGNGSLVGLSAAIMNSPFALTATASTDAQIGQMTRSSFISLIEEDAALYLSVVQLLAREALLVHQALAEKLQG